MVVKQQPMQSLPITTEVVSLNPVHGEVSSIQHYMIKFVSDLRQVGGFLWVLAQSKTSISWQIFDDEQPAVLYAIFINCAN